MSSIFCSRPRERYVRTSAVLAVALLAALSFVPFGLVCGLSIAFACPFVLSATFFPLSSLPCLRLQEEGTLLFIPDILVGLPFSLRLSLPLLFSYG